MADRFREPSAEEVRLLLGKMVGHRVGVVGDLMLDAYLIGRVSRISPEAPVPIFEIEREEFTLGGAANVAKCLIALGAQVRLCGIVGKDTNGELLLKEAAGLGIDTRGVIVDAHRSTTLKSRIVAQQQQVIRLDRETTNPLPPNLEKRLARCARNNVAWADAVLLSDYAKGALSKSVCRSAIRAAANRPVVVDPKSLPWSRFAGATVLKPNRDEAQNFCGFALNRKADASRAARQLREKVKVRDVLVTRGHAGMTLVYGFTDKSCDNSDRTLHLSSRPRGVFDVTGAGDVVAATLTLALACGVHITEATWLANAAAGIEVGKFGAAPVTGQEIIGAIDAGKSGYERKLLTHRNAASFAAHLRHRGKKVVFTNGCFDILHVGHVSYLEQSKHQGDALIVGVNSDASVRRQKGPGRPIQSQDDRSHIVAAQACVDAVVLFDQDTPVQLLKAIKPDVLTKGGDYKVKRDVVGWKMVEDWGGRVELIPLIQGRSTSKLIRQAKKRR